MQYLYPVQQFADASFHSALIQYLYPALQYLDLLAVQ